MQLEDPARAQLAEQAAAGLPVLPRLRLIWLGEALSAPPPRRPLELNAELEALAAAAQESVRRRPGWLYFAPGSPSRSRRGAALPFASRRAVLDAGRAGEPRLPRRFAAGRRPPAPPCW